MAAGIRNGNLAGVFSVRLSTTTECPNRKAVLAIRDAAVRKALTCGIRRSRRSRDEISERMSDLLGRPITVRLLNRWTATSKQYAKFPLCYVDAFCQAVGDDTLRWLVLSPELCEMLELGQRAAAILDRHVQKQLLAPSNGDVKSRRKSAIRLKAAAKSQRARHPNGRRVRAQEARA